jgi:hypothetical protein
MPRHAFIDFSRIVVGPVIILGKLDLWLILPRFV